MKGGGEIVSRYLISVYRVLICAFICCSVCILSQNVVVSLMLQILVVPCQLLTVYIMFWPVYQIGIAKDVYLTAYCCPCSSLLYYCNKVHCCCPFWSIRTNNNFIFWTCGNVGITMTNVFRNWFCVTYFDFVALTSKINLQLRRRYISHFHCVFCCILLLRFVVNKAYHKYKQADVLSHC